MISRLIHRIRNHRPPRLVRISLRYNSYTLKSYAACKLASDPVYKAVAERLLPTEHAVVDIGCGIGLCPFFLRECGYEGRVLGVDPDEAKIAAARKLAEKRYANIEFRVLDGADPAVFAARQVEPCHVVMLDVLHFMSPATQAALLARIADAVVPGGWAIVRVTLRDESWRYKVTRAEDRMIKVIGWISAPPIYYPTRDEITAPFDSGKFDIDVRPLWGKTPFNSYLCAFRKREA